MSGHCLHCRGTGFRNPSRERDAIERDAILLWCAEHAFTRWTEAQEHERDRYRGKAVRLRQHMADYENVV